MSDDFNSRISFDTDRQIMEVDFSDLSLPDSQSVNQLYDRLEERIAETGEQYWFFLINYSGMRIDPAAWVAYRRRGKDLNLAHSQGSVRYDASDETRRQIERDARTERFDPNLFADRESALARIAQLPSKRRPKVEHVTEYSPEDFARRLRFFDDQTIMEADFSNFTFAHSGDVNAFYDFIEDAIRKTDRKWFFLVNYENCQIYPEAWVAYARRGKRLNLAASLGSVRYAPGSETEEEIRMRAESQEFRPNIRNTREEALQRIEEMRRELVGQG